MNAGAHRLADVDRDGRALLHGDPGGRVDHLDGIDLQRQRGRTAHHLGPNQIHSLQSEWWIADGWNARNVRNWR